MSHDDQPSAGEYTATLELRCAALDRELTALRFENADLVHRLRQMRQEHAEHLREARERGDRFREAADVMCRFREAADVMCRALTELYPLVRQSNQLEDLPG
jgi:demethoxyubiquinone hydroxylase (CLK1/Coq7/Cat5 family)